jgi:hypothetical protein
MLEPGRDVGVLTNNEDVERLRVAGFDERSEGADRRSFAPQSPPMPSS